MKLKLNEGIGETVIKENFINGKLKIWKKFNE